MADIGRPTLQVKGQAWLISDDQVIQKVSIPSGPSGDGCHLTHCQFSVVVLFLLTLCFLSCGVFWQIS